MRNLTDDQIETVMFGWMMDTEHTFQEMIDYTHYLIQIRDRLIWQELNHMCGYDMVTAVKIAEMQ